MTEKVHKQVLSRDRLPIGNGLPMILEENPDPIYADNNHDGHPACAFLTRTCNQLIFHIYRALLAVYCSVRGTVVSTKLNLVLLRNPFVPM